ncbi:helix-turn-helix domain-containing protein [Neobacillus drentensis]|uniref:helix-turn-helix domain-containing protein n=1 Tax=Neobacillus drentensis TaxID=220684 RepID=UPI002864E1C1|nr:helix-turn-helix transcriptional regulator [Neobacillus drentensis]MDR7237306.1 transcriptional regulator with XRE-family HTH domain [Neobacillus drentensis]
MIIGKIIKQERLKKGFSSRELSEMIGASPTFVSQVERGLIKVPSPAYAAKLSQVLGIDSERLINENEARPYHDMFTKSVVLEDIKEALEHMERDDLKILHHLFFNHRDALLTLGKLPKNQLLYIKKFMDFLLIEGKTEQDFTDGKSNMKGR